MKIIKTDKSETIEGTNDDDVIIAKGGDDSIWAWYGDDTIKAGGGNDIIGVFQGTDHVDGGAGSDLLWFYFAKNDVSVDLMKHRVTFRSEGGMGRTIFTNIEGVAGSKFGDNLKGSKGDDRLYGQEGSDIIKGRGGDDLINGGTSGDTLFGNEGNDRFIATSGTDRINGGSGIDALDFILIKPGVTISLAEGRATFSGGKDPGGKVIFTSVENVFGTEKRDTLTGDEENNTLGGRGGDDTIAGAGGDDVIGGGTGHDVLTGGAGSDVFYFDEFASGDSDVITDFDVAEDRIALLKSGLDVIGEGETIKIGIFDAQTLAAAQFETNATGEATGEDTRVIYETDTGIVWYDANGSAEGERHMIAELTGAPTLTIDNFLVMD